MIEIKPISHEFSSLVDRRRELLTILGSTYAGLGIFFQNTLQGSMPEALRAIETHLFAYYSLLLMACSLVIALRMARLHGGMVVNGVLLARLHQELRTERTRDPRRSARLNVVGASFLQFILVDLIAGFSASVLAVVLGASWMLSVAAGMAIWVAWLAIYMRFHHRAAELAFRRIENESCGPVTAGDWDGHVSSSLEDVNKDLLGLLGFVGLMFFSALETLSSLGHFDLGIAAEIRAQEIKAIGPQVYTGLMVIICLLSIIIYLRLRVAVGVFSLELDPTDQPFRPFRLTDSFLGYVLLCFLFGVAMHLFLIVILSGSGHRTFPFLLANGGLVLLAILAEPLTLVLAGRRYLPGRRAAVPKSSRGES